MDILFVSNICYKTRARIFRNTEIVEQAIETKISLLQSFYVAIKKTIISMNKAQRGLY